ncbi:MAG: hypothetical protein H7A23_00695 [Leptospiraceae bacterium]|nr:hypothetical protein [Leptospiraceae bacterium]MCP5493048.1 hypothetical protein [Leptospiraceae bacterium]
MKVKVEVFVICCMLLLVGCLVSAEDPAEKERENQRLVYLLGSGNSSSSSLACYSSVTGICVEAAGSSLACGSSGVPISGCEKTYTDIIAKCEDLRVGGSSSSSITGNAFLRETSKEYSPYDFKLNYCEAKGGLFTLLKSDYKGTSNSAIFGGSCEYSSSSNNFCTNYYEQTISSCSYVNSEKGNLSLNSLCNVKNIQYSCKSPVTNSGSYYVKGYLTGWVEADAKTDCNSISGGNFDYGAQY